LLLYQEAHSTQATRRLSRRPNGHGQRRCIGRTASPTLNVRTGPSTAFQKVAELKKGNSVQVFEQNSEGWYCIGTGRWVLGKFVQLA
jgi:uncharacterized protein YgiM (DUF1202 family)